MFLSLLPALIWAPFSFLLHNLIHELAHGLTATWFGARIKSIWPFPSTRLGYFTWAYVDFTELKRGIAPMLIAPVVAELLWMSAFGTAAALTYGWVQAVLMVEVVSSNVDIVVWLLGWWNPAQHSYCDAERFRTELKFSRTKGKLLSLLQLIPIALSALLLWKVLTHL